MCQILCLTSHDPAKRDQIIQSAWNSMKLTQRDGFGAAWRGTDGQIGYHKRRYPLLNEGPKFALPQFIAEKAAPTDGFSASNDVPSDGGFLIIHGRIATNAITLNNTHPMMSGDGTAALIHNGCVDSDVYENTAGCTCDSELLMHAYLTGGIEEVNETISGYFAFMMIRIEDGKATLHVAKDSRAYLYGGKMKKGWAFATNETLLERVGAEVQGEVRANHLIVFTGPHAHVITPFERNSTFITEYQRQQRAHTCNRTPVSYPALPLDNMTDAEKERKRLSDEQTEIERQEQEELRWECWRSGV